MIGIVKRRDCVCQREIVSKLPAAYYIRVATVVDVRDEDGETGETACSSDTTALPQNFFRRVILRPSAG